MSCKLIPHEIARVWNEHSEWNPSLTMHTMISLDGRHMMTTC